MSGNITILVAVILFSIVLIALLVLRPSITTTRGGKMLAFVALLIFPSTKLPATEIRHLEQAHLLRLDIIERTNA